MPNEEEHSPSSRYFDAYYFPMAQVTWSDNTNQSITTHAQGTVDAQAFQAIEDLSSNVVEETKRKYHHIAKGSKLTEQRFENL